MYDKDIFLDYVESAQTEDILNSYIDDEAIFTEAVFENGRKTIDPLIKGFKGVKDKLDSMLKDVKESKDGKTLFDAKAYWKDDSFKKLEDAISEIFGFRDVVIQPYQESYLKSADDFKSRAMNAFVLVSDRYPIQGLVTKNGFYDKSKSLRMNVTMTMGLIRDLTAEELSAVLLHEFGHMLDPANVTISYTEANVLSKYLLDRKGSISEKEKKATGGKGLMELILSMIAKHTPAFKGILQTIFDFISGGKYTNWLTNRYIEKIKRALSKEKVEFNRTEYGEAFADNFARMYGLGVPLSTALKKLDDSMISSVESYYRLDTDRRLILTHITLDLIRDEHKTNIHRAYSLLKEYKADINDPTIPAATKKALREDMENLEKILHEYTHGFDDMQNRINKCLIDELGKKYGIDIKSDPKDKNE